MAKSSGMSPLDAIRKAAPIRVRPILMTQLTTVLGLMPLAMNLGEGGDMLVTMAIAVIGGLLYSLLLTLLFLPVVVAVQIALTIGLGMLLATANLFYRDVRQIFGVAIQLWMFISAVVVPVPRDGSLLARVISTNPLVPIIGAYRDCVVYGRWPEPMPFLYASAVAVLVLITGWACLRRASFRFAECV